MANWREEVLSILNFHEEHQEKYGIAHNGRPKKGVPKGWSLRDTAKELKLPLGAVSEIINVAKEIKKGGLTDALSDKLAKLKIKEQKYMESLGDNHNEM